MPFLGAFFPHFSPLKSSVMKQQSTNKSLDFFLLFERFIRDSQKGRRRQPNGKRLSPGTIVNYATTLRLLKAFSLAKSFPLRIRIAAYLNRRELQVEKNYWKKFYRKLTDYLYQERGCFDNYVGFHIRIIKTFFNYLNKDLSIDLGDIQRLFYVPGNSIPIFPLMPEELSFIIFNKPFENSLDVRMKKIKDVFVLGCTVGLRVSDLLRLRSCDLRVINDQFYLSTRSRKTSADSLIKLPEYAVKILERNNKNGRLLPAFTVFNLNKGIKKLLELAGFTNPVRLTRERMGKAILIGTVNNGGDRSTRFCDVASTHTMRRTAITTLLTLGAPESLVRQISGHAPGSKEFYRYVLWSQAYLDKTTGEVFQKLAAKSTAWPIKVSD
jgi:site-specific recombinase XerD